MVVRYAGADWGGRISRAQLQRAAASVGGAHEIESRHGAGVSEPLEGNYQMLPLRPGLFLRRADVRDCGDNVARATLKPGVKLIVVEQGDVEVMFGHHYLRLRGPRPGEGLRARLLVLTGPAHFQRRAARGHRERSITLTADPQWLAASGLMEGGAELRALLERHLFLHVWSLTPRGTSLAQRAARPPLRADCVDRLLLEAACIELLAEGLRDAARTAAGAAGGQLAAGRIDPRHVSRLLDLRARIDALKDVDGLTLAELAAQSGLSVRAVQQGFRALTGTTAMDYLRTQRLRAAHQALRGKGVSVAQAAALAGYGSAANFATAFKRMFGILPRDVRSHG